MGVLRLDVVLLEAEKGPRQRKFPREDHVRLAAGWDVHPTKEIRVPGDAVRVAVAVQPRHDN